MYLSICLSISCSNQKHRHRDATCPKQLNQGRSCKNIRQQSQQQRKRKKHWYWNQQQNIMANNFSNHKQAFEGLASACHHQIQQTKQQTIGSVKDVYLTTVHRWHHMDKRLTTCPYQDWESSELWQRLVTMHRQWMDSRPKPRHPPKWHANQFDEKKSYNGHLDEDEENNQQTVKDWATSMPKQPTKQRIN